MGGVTGDWTEKELSISIEGHGVVAEVFRCSMFNCEEGRFTIKINAGGVDASFILLVVMAIGEIYRGDE